MRKIFPSNWEPKGRSSNSLGLLEHDWETPLCGFNCPVLSEFSEMMGMGTGAE